MKVPLVPTEYADFLTDNPDDKITATTTEDPFAAFGKDDYGDKDEDIEEKEFSVKYYPEPYCAIFNSLDDVCFEDSIFELFGQHGIVDVDFIESLSLTNILDGINGPQKSGIFSGIFLKIPVITVCNLQKYIF